MKKIGILGGGVWGSALAKLLSKHKVMIYARDEKIVSSINEYRINPKLKYVIFNDNVKATNEISKLKDSDYLIITLPTQNIREVTDLYGKCNNDQHIIIGSKGIEIESHSLISDVINTTLNTKNISILSGPSFSNEVAQNLPTAVTLATIDKKYFDEINSLFNNNNFRLYYSDDLIGCQLGGAIKNIYAIAVGISLGLQLGDNAKSALISRSFPEIVRFGKVLGADSNTLFGLSGLGDLILTCNSLKSRNTNFGHLISNQQNISIKEHLKSQETTEGYFTVQAVYQIAKEKKIDMPIVNSVYKILYKNVSIKNEISNLLNRPFTKDFNSL